MKVIKHLTFVSLLAVAFTACTNQIVAPLPHDETPQPALTPSPTPTQLAPSKTEVLPTPSSSPSLLNGLAPGFYLVYQKGKWVDFVNIISLQVMSIDGQELGTLAVDVSDKATISPDGGKIAYINFTDSGVSSLAVLDLRTNQVTYFSVAGCSIPAGTTGWSPDSTQVALSCRDYISVVDITGSTAKLVSSLRIANGVEGLWIDQVAWSPDGNYLSFYIANSYDARDSTSHGPYLSMSKCPNDATECQVSPYLLSDKSLSIAKWTPDNLLAVAQENRIYQFDPIAKQLARQFSIPVDSRILSFAWSPDNQSIAYSVTSQEPDIMTKEIYIIGVTGGKPILLARNADDVTFWMQVPTGS
jgi:Tol biopolymer transport system component